MQALLACIVGGIMILVGCIHLYWLLGGRGGFAIAVPTSSDTNKPLFIPRKVDIAGVILLFWAAAALLLMHAGVIPAVGPAWLPSFAGWSLAVVLLLRAIGEFRVIGLFKSKRGTPFARMDTLIYSPLCLALCTLTVWMMIIE